MRESSGRRLSGGRLGELMLSAGRTDQDLPSQVGGNTMATVQARRSRDLGQALWN